MNISQLELPPLVSQIQRFSVDAKEKDTNFLSFRQLNKRARVRLSPKPFPLEQLPVQLNLFSVAHSKGWFTAASQDNSGFSLIFAPLADLRETFSSSNRNDEIQFVPKRSLAIAPATPTIAAFASHDSRMLLSLTNGQILVYDTWSLFTPGSDNIFPLHSFSSLSPTAPRQILPNPGDMPNLVAVLREPGVSLSVEILDVQKMEPLGGWNSGNTPDTTPTSLSWSPKGKQLAVCLSSGDILTFSPSATGAPKLRIPPLLSSNNEPQTLVSATWLFNPTFHVVYAPPSPPDAEQAHFVVTQEARSSALSCSKLNLPIYSIPGLVPSQFILVLRSWDPMKMLLIIGDRSSSDVGVIGSIGEDWHILGLEEADTPRLPLDKDGNETVLVALEIDLSSSQKLRTSIAGEDVELPPPPVMYAYTSDGTVQAWYVVNAQGMAYPGMMPLSPSLLGSSTIQDQGGASSAFVSGTSMSPTQSQAVTTGAFGQQSTLMSGGQGSAFSSQTPPGFGRPSQMPATFGQATFTQASASGQPSVFGQPSFGQPSAFGQAKPITESAFPSKFGQTSFGFGATAAPSTTFPAALVSTAPPPQPVASSAEYEMSMDAGSSFGGLSLGTDSGEKLKFGLGKGIFGRYNPSPLSLPPDHSANTPAFSTSFEAIKPAAGFGIGTFVQQQSPSQCLPQSSEQGIPAPSSAFGKSGFSAKPSSAFGQSSFSAALPVITAPVSGGFGEYASGGPTTFGTASHSEATAKPSWSIGGGGGGGVLGASSEETTSNTVGSASTFGGGSSLVFSSAPVKSSATADAFPSSPSSSGSGSPPNFRVNNSSSASPFVGHSPAGAFGQLKTSSMSFVKPATGAFGSDAMPASSPFFNTSSATNLSVSVFATSSPSSPPATNIGTSTPTFGASSVLGTAKPAIGTSPITPSPVKPSTAATSAFSKYTGPSVGFSIVPSASKPVAALLNSGDDARDPEKSSISLSTPAPKPSGDTKVTSATSTPKAGVFDNDGERSSFMADGAVRQKSVDPMVQPPVTSMADSTNFMVPVFSKPREDTIASPVDEMGKEKDSDSVPAVKMDAEASGSDQAEESGMEHASCSDEVKHLEQLEDDTQSFLSASLSGDSEGPPDDEYTSDETGSSSSSLPVEPFNIPLPITPQSTSRSPSATPKLAVIEATSSPSQRSPSPKVRDASTTPPGSPVKELSSLLPKSPLLAPTPVLPSALGLGLARPSTRPARSSPLANVTLSDADEGDRIAQSKVASPKETPKAHPASPKPTFGLLKFPTKPSTPDEEPSGNKAARPKTPPLLSSFITPAPKTPTVTLSTASPPPPPLLVDKPGGIKPTASTAMHQSNPDVFGGRAEGLPLPAFASSGLSGSKMVTSSSSNPAAFMPNETPTMSSSKTVQTATPTLMPLERPLEQGIQAECLYLFSSLGKDIEELRKFAQLAGKKRTELDKPSDSLRYADRIKRTLRELQQMPKGLKKDLCEMKVQKTAHLRAIRELESQMLKALTRKEEILRFNRAQTDTEFAKMLKSRTLGPEHLETQSQLRRDIKAVRDRVQKLEDHLQASKKKLVQMKTGMPGLKAPSLDTINRTYYNIDIAIEQQAQDVANLAAKIANMRVGSESHMSSTRDKRLPDTGTRRRVNVTPHVAISTATALNAERSAQRLKLALLTVRKEPLLNVEAASAHAHVAFDSLRKSNTFDSDAHGRLLAWGVSDLNESPSHALPSRRTSGVVSKRHMPPVALRRSPTSQTTTPPKFDWGPLPSVSPMKTISLDVRRRDQGSPKSLGGSWVMDDFRT